MPATEGSWACVAHLRSGDGVGDLHLVGLVGQGTEQDPAVAVPRAAVENFDDELVVVRTEEGERSRPELDS